jgi:Divergent InlB B-repeat domain
MKKFMFITLVTVAVVCFPHRSYAQGSLAPLFLSIDGGGSITPFQNGQLLEVGRNYTMTAIPDSGFVFSSWQPANVFVSSSGVTNNGTVYTTTNTVIAPIPSYTETPSLTFTMQPQVEILNNLYENSGWMANFVPVPEPPGTTLVACGLTAALMLRRSETTKNATLLFGLETSEESWS